MSSATSTPSEQISFSHSAEHYFNYARDLRLEFGVDERWLPLKHRSYDPIRVAIDLHEWLDDRPVWNESVTRVQLARQLPYLSRNAGPPYEPIMFMAGWWPLRHTSTSGTHYANPEYVHGHTGVTDCERREHYLDVIADLPTIEPNELIDLFNVNSEKSMWTIIRRSDIDWRTRRQEARARMAATWATLRQLGYVYREIGAAFGTTRHSVGDYIGKYLPEGFVPPTHDALYRDLESQEWRRQ